MWYMNPVSDLTDICPGQPLVRLTHTLLVSRVLLEERRVVPTLQRTIVAGFKREAVVVRNS